MMAGGLHVHELNLEAGTLTATLGDAMGRHLCIEVKPEDSVAVGEALARLEETIIAAVTTVMLDLVGLTQAEATIPDTCEDLVSSIPCRICGTPVEVPGFTEDQRPHLLRTTRCVTCAAIG